MYRGIKLSFGHAEHTMSATLSIISSKTFSSKRLLVEEFIKFLLKRFRIEYYELFSNKGCCQYYQDINKYKYCPECGHMLRRKKFNAEMFRQFIKDIFNSTEDYFHSIDDNDENEWRVSNALPQDFYVRVFDCAEFLLTKIGEMYPEYEIEGNVHNSVYMAEPKRVIMSQDELISFVTKNIKNHIWYMNINDKVSVKTESDSNCSFIVEMK